MSGGGTAGHVYPALTVAERLVAEHDEVVFVGTPDGLESRLVVEAGIPFQPLPASGFDRSRPWTLITSSLRVAMSALRAWRLMGVDRPDAVVGFGGYVSIPVGLAAVLRRVPLVVHEQNSVPGLANRVLSRWASVVCVTYVESIERLAHPERGVVTGNPVRESVLTAEGRGARELLSLKPDDLVLLVFGGSRGARHLNSAVVSLRERLLSVPELRVVLIAGRAEFEQAKAALAGDPPQVRARFTVLDYFEQMGSAIAAADLVVARAGATSIAELTALGAPCVLVPYPYATDDHQTKNAEVMAAHGAAIVIADSELDGERFGDELLALLRDPERRASMAAASLALGQPDAAETVARIARDAASGPVAGAVNREAID